jgi:hypothetical protein
MKSTFIKSRVLVALTFVFGIVIGSIAVAGATAYQSHMINARASLFQARAQLTAAMADKAGHRVAAINLVNQAIAQVNAGIVAGR